jgi:hypothetical protein
MNENTPFENLLRDIINNISYDSKLEVNEGFAEGLNEVTLHSSKGEHVKSIVFTNNVLNDYPHWKCNSKREFMCYRFVFSMGHNHLNNLKHETNV